MRLIWPDLARGLAVLFMFVAHVAPGGGPILLAEFVTAPLISMLLVIGQALSWRGRKGSALGWYATQSLRGVILIVLGLLLQPLYSQILVVLQSLGALTLIAGAIVPVLDQRPQAAVAGALALSLASPLVMDAARNLHLQSSFLTWWVDLLAAGHAYRVITFLVFGLLGIAVVHWIRSRNWSARRGVVVASVLSVGAFVVVAVDQLTVDRLDADSGTTLEILFNALMTTGLVLWTAVLQDALGPLRARQWFRPLTATGRLALTAYTLQLIVLAVIVRVFLGGGRDDSWFVLAALTTIVVGFCWLWDRLGWPGPLESALRLPGRLLRGV